MEYVTCNLCNAAETRHLYTVPDLLLDRETVRATLVQCQQCGLVYQNPRPTLAEIGQHYPPEYDPYEDHANSDGTWLRRKAIEYGLGKRCRYVTRHKEAGRLLDIGCAAGHFLLGMRMRGEWELYGVELSDEVAGIARQRHNLNVVTGTLEEAGYPDAFFDAITMWDVLEHLHDPTGSLREIHRILKPGGLLVIRVPNLASWDAAVFGRYWAGLDAPRHLYLFTPTTLRRMLQDAGFTVTDEDCGIGGYVTFALSVRFWMTARHIAPAYQRRVRTLLYHPLTRIATAPLFYLPAQTLRGTLLVVTAHKR